MSFSNNTGDIVIVQKKKSAQNGDIVVCINDEKALIKQIYKGPNAIILQSINTEFKPFNAAEDFRIEGIVRSII